MPVLKYKKFGYKVDIQQYCSHSEREPEQFGSWSEEYTNDFKRITQIDEKGYPDVVSSVDLKNTDQPAYLVWVEYSTGDSFGYATRGSTEVIGLFHTFAAAKEMRVALEQGEKSEYSYERTFESSDGQHLKFHTPWTGFFERLEEVHIETVG